MATSTLSRDKARALDRRAIEEFGVPGIVLMENAGRGAADFLCSLGIAGPVAICCGGGNNGGDGFVAARHLDLRGHTVKVLLLADPNRLRGDAMTNYRVLTAAGPLPVVVAENEFDAHLAGCGCIVDALLGTGATGEPRSPIAEAIEQMNASGVPIVAIDVPSGFDCDTGQAAIHTIRAGHTCTFVAHKPGFLVPGAERYTGKVHVVDIGAPRRLVEEMLGGRP